MRPVRLGQFLFLGVEGDDGMAASERRLLVLEVCDFWLLADKLAELGATEHLPSTRGAKVFAYRRSSSSRCILGNLLRW